MTTSSSPTLPLPERARLALAINREYQQRLRFQLARVREAQKQNQLLQRRLDTFVRHTPVGPSLQYHNIAAQVQPPKPSEKLLDQTTQTAPDSPSTPAIEATAVVGDDISQQLSSLLASLENRNSLAQGNKVDDIISRNQGTSASSNSAAAPDNAPVTAKERLAATQEPVPTAPPTPSVTTDQPATEASPAPTKVTRGRASEKTSLAESCKEPDTFAPYFVDVEGTVPPQNPDAVVKAKYAPVLSKPRRWSDRERRSLAEGVRTQNKRIIADRLSQSQDVTRVLLDVDALPSRELEINLQGLDWRQIATDFVKSRQASECAIQWTCHDHPLINKTDWTPSELKQLREIVDNAAPRNWPTIAEELGTNRTAAQCFRKYREWSLANTQKRRWTAEEDAMLRQAVQIYGEKNWQQIAHILDNRTGQQCLHRWTKSVNPIIRRGRWDPEEDEALLTAVEIYGEGNWRQVQHYVLSRTDVQCRERYCNVLHPHVNQGPWTEIEDAKLLHNIRAIGLGKWSQIADLMDKRTDNQCWRRWKALVRAKKIDKERLFQPELHPDSRTLLYPEALPESGGVPEPAPIITGPTRGVKRKRRGSGRGRHGRARRADQSTRRTASPTNTATDLPNPES
ncbi:hypothetical protein H4R34_004821 [Dimargaris verticillata]|uniref:Homeodomain-like protein n=1 Tax=Dimargaris verticillata TaxID=2761393 RepID=A0A9W8B3G0_9FUNG|nr:hypothetical protein H4R34_004821 [Dimargaris verticillata]